MQTNANNIYLIFFICINLESIRNLEHSIGSVHIILLRVLREFVDTIITERSVCLNRIVATTLLITMKQSSDCSGCL